MKTVAILALAALPALAQSPTLVAGEPKDPIMETTDAATGVRALSLRKTHEVFDTGKAPRMFKSTMRLSPILAESINKDEQSLVLGLRVKVPTAAMMFTYAAVLLNIDGTVSAPVNLNWTAYSTWADPNTQDVAMPTTADQLRSLARAKDVYVTVLLPGTQIGKISFKLSPEQLADCRSIIERYDAARASR